MPRQRKRSLPEWFPLPIYQQQLGKGEWLTEIGLRLALQTAEENKRSGKTARSTSDGPPDETFFALFVTRDSRAEGGLAQAKDRNFWPIQEPTSFEVFFLAENQRNPGQPEAEEWAKRLHHEGKDALGEFFSSGAIDKMAELKRDISEEPSGVIYMDVLGKRAPVLVDLDHDDKTLELAFKVWLAGARDAMNQKARRPVGEKEFSRWMKFGLLPAFDLIFWSQARGERFTDAFIARAIWPDDGTEFVDLTERFRKVTRTMVAEVFNWDFVMRFWRQMELEYSLDAMVERQKATNGASGGGRSSRKRKAKSKSVKSEKH